jgi:hypothetical protein
MRRIAIALVALACGAGPAVSAATIRTVGPTGTYSKPCAAIAAAQAGDTIQIDAAGNGTYDGDVCQWTVGGLTIEGVNGRAHIDAAGQAAVGKGIWVIDGANTTVKNVELSGASVPDGNGAGIRAEGAGLTVTGSVFRNNQDGILASDNASSDIVIESSEFDRNGAGDGQTHNIYIGHVRSFVLRFSYSHDAVGGHLVKSRADATDILYNRLTGEGGSSAYELDLPNGGPARVIGNSIQQGAATTNAALLAYGEEGSLHADSQLSMVNNTFVDDRGTGSDTALLVGGTVTAPVLAQNDIRTGATTFVSQGSATLTTNCTVADPMFVAPATFDYHLQPGSPCLGVGTRPADPLVPAMQYVHPLGGTARTDAGAAAGAFSNEPVSDPGSTTEPPTTTPPTTTPPPTKPPPTKPLLKGRPPPIKPLLKGRPPPIKPPPIKPLRRSLPKRRVRQFPPTSKDGRLSKTAISWKTFMHSC